jgi:hypothetical protein
MTKPAIGVGAIIALIVEVSVGLFFLGGAGVVIYRWAQFLRRYLMDETRVFTYLEQPGPPERTVIAALCERSRKKKAQYRFPR